MGASFIRPEAGEANIRRLPDMTADAILLSNYPAEQRLEEPRVCPDGHLYAYSTAEALVSIRRDGLSRKWRIGLRPPQKRRSRRALGEPMLRRQRRCLLIDGRLRRALKLSADGKTGASYNGQAAEIRTVDSRLIIIMAGCFG